MCRPRQEYSHASLPSFPNYPQNMKKIKGFDLKFTNSLRLCRFYIEIKFRILPDFHHSVEHCQCFLVLFFTCLFVEQHVLECAVAEMDACLVPLVFRCAESEYCSKIDPKRISVCT